MTKVNVIVDKYPDDDIDLYDALIDRVEIWRKATEGIGRFKLTIKNDSGEYIGVFEADDPVEIKIKDIIFMHGYLDSSLPVSQSRKDAYEQTLDLSGRDYGQDLMNKMINKSITLENPGIKGDDDIYPYVNKHADDIIDSMLANAYSEIAFVSPHTAEVITYEDTGSQYLIEALRKILEQINYDSYVDKNAVFQMFPIGTIDSGIILQTGINILKLKPIEFDAHELRNFIIARGKDVTDGWTEGNCGDFTGDAGNTITNEYTKVKLGAASIKCVRGDSTDWCAFILTFPKFGYDYLPFDRFGTKEIAAWLSYTTSSEQSKSKRFHVELTDTDNNVLELIKHIIGPVSPERLAEWDRISFPIGHDCEIVDADPSWAGYWTYKTGTSFNWKVIKIKIRSHMYSSTEVHTIYLDGLNIPIPMVAYAQDEDSEEYYKVRHAFVNGRNCETQAELQALAESTLAKCMEPIEGLKIIALGNAGIIGGECKWIPGYKVKVHSPGDGIVNVWYRIVDVHLIVSEEPIMNGQDFIAEVDLIPYAQEVQTRRLGFIKDPGIGLIRQLNDALRTLEELEEPKRDWWPTRPRPMSHADLFDVEPGQHHDEFTEGQHEDVDHTGYGIVLEGTLANRPAFGVAGRIYHATDTNEWFLDTGVAWQDIIMPADLDIPVGPPGDPTGLTATALPLQILLRWDVNTEADMDRYIIYRGTSPNPTTEYTRVDTTHFSDANVEYGITYYYRIKARDRVGNLSGYSNEVSSSPLKGFVPTDPAAPTLTAENITVETIVDNDGTTKTYFVITFARVANAFGYVLSFRKSVGAFSHLMQDQSAEGEDVVIKTGPVELDTNYYFKLASMNEFKELSDWTDEVGPIRSGIDTTPPDTPTGLDATGMMGGILLSWNRSTAKDFSHYNVFVSDTTTPPDTATFVTKSSVYKYETDDYGTPYYFWISAVDITGNESNKCNYDSDSAKQVGHPDIGLSAVEADNIMNLAVEEGKLADSAVAEAKIATDAVIADKIKNAEVLWDKLSDETKGKITAKTTWFAEAESDIIYRNTNTTIIDDATARGGQCIRRLSGAPSDWMFGCHPGIEIDGGNYWALFRMKVTNNASEANLIVIDAAVTARGVIASRQLHANDFEESEVWQTFAVPVEIRQNDTPSFEVRGWSFVTGITDVFCDYVALIPMAKISTDLLEAYAITAGKIAAGAVTTPKLDAGAVTAQKLTVYSIFLTDLDVIDHFNIDHPDDDYITWTPCKVQYEGIEYSVVIGATNHKYIWWDKNDSPTTFKHSDTKPSWAEDKFIIMINEAGVHTLLWNATLIHGGGIITDTITAKEIASKTITSEQIHAGAITADEIDTDAVTALKIKAGEIDTDHLAAGAITADKIDADAVTAIKIHADAVTAKKLCLERIADQDAENALNPSEGNLWWRTDKDQLRFHSGKIEAILKEPLYSAPEENKVLNASFEEDRDDDDIPDYWSTHAEAGAPIFERSTLVSWRGEHSFRIYCNTAQAGRIDSVWISVVPNKKYLFSVDINASATATLAYGVGMIEFWNADKSACVGSIGLPAGVSAGWNHFSNTVASPATARWAHVKLYNMYPNVDLSLYFDNIFFSEQKAAIPTAEVVAAKSAGLYGGDVVVSENTWTKIRELIVPTDGENIHELLFVLALVRGIVIRFDSRLKLIISGVNYPMTEGIVDHSKLDQGGTYYVRSERFDVPFDCRGKTLELWFKGSAGTYSGFLQCWGHSPHTHR